MCYNYYYDDNEPNPNMDNILTNKNNNKDYKKINDIIQEQDKKQSNLKIESSFRFLIIENIYLGFNSAPKIYKTYKTAMKRKGLSEKDASHPSLFFMFSKDCSYFVDYIPDQGKATNVTFVYGNDKFGLRYGNKSFKDFTLHNDTCIVELKSEIKKNFYQFFEEISKVGTWDQKNHDIEKHNCNHFCIESLKLLEAKRKSNNIDEDFIITKPLNESKKDAIKHNIPFIFFNILNIENL